ncbi:alpha/beta hydrolase [Phaeocystidibacter luteus]|uniref:Esterase family protein n=1 Tax=Phaeocystidibacter luteus TaxID=911197 RepID=A0A6N6RCP3_9FLAO|nr:alpha/beta hydrolase-fold protein [Phaeocystidibacter luteus]KAB2805339.1 esterase family protein [Phaeocystidibacter luteus]
MRRLLPLLILFVIIACESTPEPPATGKLELIGNWSPERLSRRDVWVWTPPNYDTAQTYPVIIMHDGQMLFDSTSTWNGQEWQVDETMNRLIADGEIRPAIIVAVANGDKYRRTDYLPTKVVDALPEAFRDTLLEVELENRSRADDYVRFMISELKPFIQGNYSVSEQPSDYFVMGSSMGGLISLYTVTQFPEHFGGAACMSTHWPGSLVFNDGVIPEAMFEYLSGHMPNPNACKLYFDHGTVGLDSLYRPYQAKMDSIALAYGYTGNQYRTIVFDGAEHSERAWAARLHAPLKFLLGKP